MLLDEGQDAIVDGSEAFAEGLVDLAERADVHLVELVVDGLQFGGRQLAQLLVREHARLDWIIEETVRVSHRGHGSCPLCSVQGGKVVGRQS